ncbi:MAG: leucine-rich repeat domain-containing protein, partial [Turicibacter sp.]|nr:leucine-rich repeat domain-containing protein [Turicibacter sp.]
ETFAACVICAVITGFLAVLAVASFPPLVVQAAEPFRHEAWESVRGLELQGFSFRNRLRRGIGTAITEENAENLAKILDWEEDGLLWSLRSVRRGIADLRQLLPHDEQPLQMYQRLIVVESRLDQLLEQTRTAARLGNQGRVGAARWARLSEKYAETLALVEDLHENMWVWIFPPSSAEQADFIELWSGRISTEITALDLSHQNLRDLEPLAELTNLRFLNLSSNQITDISPLASLVNLRDLDLSRNEITDLRPLAELANLEVLELWNNRIMDVRPLADLQLNRLELSNNMIFNISPLENMVGLWHLGLGNNRITDISPLAGLRSLRSLSISEISGLHGDIDITPLSQLQNLDTLAMVGNNISDISALAELRFLRSLWLGRNEISDLTPLADMTTLQVLMLNNNNIRDLSPLANLTGIMQLSLSVNEISDVSPLASLELLQSLSLRGNPVCDISPLAGLQNLQAVNFSDTLIVDFSAVGEDLDDWYWFMDW